MAKETCYTEIWLRPWFFWILFIDLGSLENQVKSLWELAGITTEENLSVINIWTTLHLTFCSNLIGLSIPTPGLLHRLSPLSETLFLQLVSQRAACHLDLSSNITSSVKLLPPWVSCYGETSIPVVDLISFYLISFMSFTSSGQTGTCLINSRVFSFTGREETNPWIFLVCWKVMTEHFLSHWEWHIVRAQ